MPAASDWSKTQLLERWISNPLECCESAGVQAPASLASGSVVSPLDQKLICADQQDTGLITVRRPARRRGRGRVGEGGRAWWEW